MFNVLLALADGLIAEVRRRPAAADDDSRRRYYRLTDEGRRTAVAEAHRMEELLVRARSKRLVKAWS